MEVSLGIFLLAELVSPCIGTASHLSFGETYRLTGIWERGWTLFGNVVTGMDVNYWSPDFISPTYVCRAYMYNFTWAVPSDVIVGAYQPDAGCCTIALSNGMQECLDVTDGADLEFLVNPEDGFTAEWSLARAGVVSPSDHYGLIIGGLIAFIPELVCRFDYVNEKGQELILQGRIPAHGTTCLAGLGYRPGGKQVQSAKYELLVYRK